MTSTINGFDIASLAISSILVIATLITLIIMIITLRADHDWRRRQFTLNLNEKWLEMTDKSTIYIEKQIPHIRYSGPDHEKSEISKVRAKEIYCYSNDQSTYELRSHI